MLQTKHLRKIPKIAFTPSAPCERTFCMQKSSYRGLPDNCTKLYYNYFLKCKINSTHTLPAILYTSLTSP